MRLVGLFPMVLLMAHRCMAGEVNNSAFTSLADMCSGDPWTIDTNIHKCVAVGETQHIYKWSLELCKAANSQMLKVVQVLASLMLRTRLQKYSGVWIKSENSTDKPGEKCVVAEYARLKMKACNSIMLYACVKNVSDTCQVERKNYCAQKCVNSGYREVECRCNEGYSRFGLRSCTNYNPCLEDFGGCDQVCTLTPSNNANCSCHRYFEQVKNTAVCKLKSPCNVNNGGCYHHCNERLDGWRDCVCPGGMVTSDIDPRDCVFLNDYDFLALMILLMVHHLCLSNLILVIWWLNYTLRLIVKSPPLEGMTLPDKEYSEYADDRITSQGDYYDAPENEDYYYEESDYESSNTSNIRSSNV